MTGGGDSMEGFKATGVPEGGGAIGGWNGRIWLAVRDIRDM